MLPGFPFVQTALLQVVLGMAKADGGEAMFQGRPIGEWEAVAYRERVAWLSQVSFATPPLASSYLLCFYFYSFLSMSSFSFFSFFFRFLFFFALVVVFFLFSPFFCVIFFLLPMFPSAVLVLRSIYY